MHQRYAVPFLALLLALAAGPAGASAPGSAPFELQGLIDFVKLVCSNDPSQVCCDPELTPAEDAIEDAMLGCTCVPEFVPGSDARMFATLIGDDNTSANNGNGGFGLAGLFEIRHGDEVYVVAEILQDANQGSGPEVGYWNAIDLEEEIFEIDFRGGKIPVLALDLVQARLAEIGREILNLPPNTAIVPVLDDPNANAARKNAVQNPSPQMCNNADLCGELEVKEVGNTTGLDGSSVPNSRASVARFRIDFKYAYGKPGAPTCP